MRSNVCRWNLTRIVALNRLNVHFKEGCKNLVTLSTFNSEKSFCGIFESNWDVYSCPQIGRSSAWTSQKSWQTTTEQWTFVEHVNCEQRNLPQSYCISFKMASRKRADHSVLKRSIETNTTGMKQAMLAMKTGSPEVTLWTMSKITSKSLRNENRVKFPEKLEKYFKKLLFSILPIFLVKLKCV